MNSKQIKEISIREVMENFSLFPERDNSITGFYLAIDRVERDPNLLVNFVHNSAIDFKSTNSFNVVSIVQTIKKCTESEALAYLEIVHNNFLNSSPKMLKDEVSKTFKIIDIKDNLHPLNLQSIVGLDVNINCDLFSEIWFEDGLKKYYGIAFKNDSGGYEIRSKYMNICLLKKDITTIKNGGKKLLVFQDYTELLTYKFLFETNESEPSDYLILNSNSMIKKIKNEMVNYNKIIVYFGNTEAGDFATEQVKSFSEKVVDGRFLYSHLENINQLVPVEEIIPARLENIR